MWIKIAKVFLIAFCGAEVFPSFSWKGLSPLREGRGHSFILSRAHTHPNRRLMCAQRYVPHATHPQQFSQQSRPISNQLDLGHMLGRLEKRRAKSFV